MAQTLHKLENHFVVYCSPQNGIYIKYKKINNNLSIIILNPSVPASLNERLYIRLVLKLLGSVLQGLPPSPTQ